MNKFKYVSILGWSVVATPVAMVAMATAMYHVHNDVKIQKQEKKQEIVKVEVKEPVVLENNTPKNKPVDSFTKKQYEAPKNQTVKGRRDTVQSERSDTAAN